MAAIFLLIKQIAIVQFFVVILLLCMAFLIRFYYLQQSKRRVFVKSQFEKLLQTKLDNNHILSVNDLKNYLSYPMMLVEKIKQLETINQTHLWLKNRQIILDALLPIARTFAISRRWYNRYIAAEIFLIQFKPEDEPLISKLIRDRIPLVSLISASLCMRSTSKKLINDVVDHLSKGRRVQQALEIHILDHTNSAIAIILNERLSVEKNPYVKVFCYRILLVLPFSRSPNCLISDLASDNLDLKLAVIAYMQKHEPKDFFAHLSEFLKDEHWEVRAKSALLLGLTGERHFVSTLEPCLQDKVWWVRINAAEALGRLGEPGLKILKAQTLAKDRFAYDVAQRVLLTREAK